MQLGTSSTIFSSHFVSTSTVVGLYDSEVATKKYFLLAVILHFLDATVNF